MKFWKIIFIHIPLFSSIFLRSTVYASSELQGRKHSTTHYFPNGTVYILGGIESVDNKDATHSRLASSTLTLRFNSKDFSLNSTDAALAPLTTKKETIFPFPPTTGHTSHIHVPSNSIISCFGLQQNNKASPPLIPSPLSSSSNQPNITIPTGRHQHSSVLIGNKLYVIGGKQASADKLVEPQDIFWEYSFSTLSWKKPNHVLTFESMAGHTTIVRNQWLISCFGYQERGLINGCTWFNTVSLKSTKTIPSSTREWPTARSYASMISLANNNEYILFGGETVNNTILDDMWKLNIDSTSFHMKWTKINYKNVDNYNYRRSGHASTLLYDSNVVLYYGGQNGSHSLATDPIYLDVSKMEWIQTKDMNGDNRKTIYKNEVDSNNINQSNGEEKHGLSGGAIGGIIIVVIVICALGIGYFVWKRRNQRRQNIHQTSRAARFSQSPTPMKNIKQNDCEKLQLDDNDYRFKGEEYKFEKTKLEHANFLSLPELALSSPSYNKQNRISAVSLGAEFRFSSDDYRRHSQLSTDSNKKGRAPRNSSNSSFSRHQLDTLSEEENKTPTTSDVKGKESTAFKRLTLNLFSGSQNNQALGKKKDRSSSLFQLRSSRLLPQPATPATPDGQYPISAKGNMSRSSLGAKSVSSIQWVGFNDNMDFKGNNWRDSSTSSIHLAVKNTRASSYYTNDSAQSTPRSPMFPSHLRDPVPQHHYINETENSSNRNKGSSLY